MKVKSAFFYTDDEMVAYTDSGWLQTAFDTLMGLFDQAELRINVCKTVGMVCQPYRAVGVRADDAYKRWMTGEGRRYQERQ